jgi:uncharacterized protein (DUF488 family)
VWSIGHSNQDLDGFLALLDKHGIEAVADVRSTPRSGYSPQFDQPALTKALRDAGKYYVFLGDELGGRPDGEEYYDRDGHVRYDLVARSRPFLSGIDRLVEGARRHRVAIMCSEEDPSNCHRRLLIARVLPGMGVDVIHLRGDGALQDDSELAPHVEASVQADLFGGGERSTWRSVRPVLQGGRPRSSSKH